ncbi:hypothetical protein CBS147324_7348 [Aspergillus niger]|nr:hypothetical protein CBS147324_7348 [Aspergillus niger]
MAFEVGRGVSFKNLSLEGEVPTEPTTQADRLPAQMPDGVPGLPLLLHGRENFSKWDFQVKQALKNVGLEDLIKLDLPRPSAQHEKFKAWHSYSRVLQSWLTGQLSGKVMDQFQASADKKDYVDDAYKAIRRIVMGHGIVLCQSVAYNLVKPKRSDYATAGDYIQDFWNNYVLAKELRCGIPPFTASLLLLREIQTDMPAWATNMECKMPENAESLCTDNDFFTLCRNAIEQSNRISDMGLAATTKSGNRISSYKSDPAGDDWKKATYPKRGVSNEDHAAKMRNIKPQYVDGACGYCRCKGHGPPKCWYIEPTIRPTGWVPFIMDIWFFRPKGDRGKRKQEPKDDSKAVEAAPAKQIAEMSAQHVALHEAESDDENLHILNFCGLAAGNTTEGSLRWIYDTGSSQHLTPDRASLNNYHDLDACNFYKYGTSDGGVGVAKSAGYQSLFLFAKERLELKIKAYYQPGLAYGLLSADRLRRDFGIYANTKDLTLRKEQDDKVVGHLQACKNVLFVRTEDAGLALAAVDPLLLHRRYGHAGFRRVTSAAKNQHIELEHRDDLHCEACSLGKAKRLVSRDPIPKTADPTQLWHADVQQVTPIGHGGFKYFLVMVNNATRLVRTAMLKQKNHASTELIRMNNEHKNMVGRYVASWHLDGGREFNKFKEWANHEDRGIRVVISPPRTPEANGLAERYGGLINQMSRVMMLDSGLPVHLWPFAVRLAAQILNRLVPTGSEVKQTPVSLYRSFYNLPNPDATLDFLRVFGCRCYQHIPVEDRVTSRKMGPRADTGYFVGFDGDHGHVYLVWYPASNKVKKSRDVTFYEDRTYKDDHEDPGRTPAAPTPKGPIIPESGTSINFDNTILRAIKNTEIDNAKALPTQNDTADEPVRGRIQTLSSSTEPSAPTGPIRSIENPADYEASSTKYAHRDFRLADSEPPSTKAVATAPRRSQRSTKGKSPQWLGNEQVAALEQESNLPPLPALKQHEVVIPNTYTEAISSPLAPYWKAAMTTQIDKIKSMKTYDIVDRPAGARVIPGKWVFDLKVNTEGVIIQFRARWVVCGNRQVPGIDYDESFAPVASEIALKMFMTNVALKHLRWEQCDIISAYLHAQIEGKRVYMKQPTGYHEGPPGRVCLLKMALYGLRQAAHLWNRTLDEKLQEIGFKPLPEDPCVYRMGDIWLIIYVDDSAIAGPEEEDLTSVKGHLNEAFGLKELGEPKVLLGCNVIRDYEAGTISLSQPTYVEECLAAANLQACSGVAIPMTPTYKKADRTTMTTDNVDINEYQSLVGRLNWLSTKSRPDLRHATFRLQRRMHDPTTADVKALKTVYRYLRDTVSYGITLATDHSKGIEVYVDAAHADHEDGKSTEGYVIFYTGGPITWSSNKQSVVAPSSTVVEYCAFDAAVKDVLYVKKLALAFDLKISDDGKIPLFSDAANSLKILNHGGYTKSTRWLDNRYLFVADLIKTNAISIQHVAGVSNPADGLTKPLDREAFRTFRRLLGMTPVSATDLHPGN